MAKHLNYPKVWEVILVLTIVFLTSWLKDFFTVIINFVLRLFLTEPVDIYYLTSWLNVFFRIIIAFALALFLFKPDTKKAFSKLGIKNALKVLGIKKEGLRFGVILGISIIVTSIILGVSLFGANILQFSAPAFGIKGFKIISEVPKVGIIFHMFGGTAEELLFRALAITVIIGINTKPSKTRIIIAVLLTSILFSLWHHPFDSSFISMINPIPGIFFSILYFASRRNIAAPCIVHAIVNIWQPVNVVLSGIFFGFGLL